MLFSVTIPTFKALYLFECICSVLEQTYTDFELIIVDDASPEDILGCVGKFNDSRIKYYRNDINCGAINVVDNWNKCLEYAEGDYIICMGDDDKLLPNCLEEYARLIEKYPGLGVYHAWTEIINEKSEFVNVTAARCEYESVYSLIWHRWDNRKLQFIGDFLFDTKLLRKNDGFHKMPLAWSSDDISAIIAAVPYGVANTQKPCFCYRVNSQTISNSDSSDIKLKAIIEEEKWYDSFLKDTPQSELDIKYWICIKKMKPLLFEKKKGLTIVKDLKKKSLFRIFYWIMNRKKYNLSMKSILYALVQSLK